MLSIFALTLSHKFCKALLFKSQLHSDSAVSALGEPHILHSSLAGYSSYPQTFWHLVSLTLAPIFFITEEKKRKAHDTRRGGKTEAERERIGLFVCVFVRQRQD